MAMRRKVSSEEPALELAGSCRATTNDAVVCDVGGPVAMVGAEVGGGSGCRVTVGDKQRALLLKYHLPLGLLCGVVLGYAWPAPGRAVGGKIAFGMGLSSIDIFIIFLISGLKLKTDDIKKVQYIACVLCV